MIRTKLTVWNCVVLSIVLTLTGLAVYFTTQRILFKGIDDGLLQRAQLFAASWHGIPGQPGGPGDMRRPDDHGDRSDKDRQGPGPTFSFNGNPGTTSGDPGPGQSASNGPDNNQFRGFENRRMEPEIDVQAAKEQGIDPKGLSQIKALQTVLRPMALDLTGKDVVHPEQTAWDKTTFEQAKSGQQAYGISVQDGIRIRVLSYPMRQNGKIAYILQFGAPMSAELQALGQLAKTLTIVLPLAVTVMLFVGVILTRRALRPVGQIASAAEQIEITNLSDRLPVHGEDEFAQLSSTFNGLLGRLEEAFQEKDQAFGQLRRFTADASHELKTPLTAIQLRTGLALRKEISAEKYQEHLLAIDRAAGQMNAVVQDLLFLAASDEGRLNLRKEDANLADIVEDSIFSVDTSHHQIERDIDPNIHLSLDPAAMTRVLVNIVKNAVLYTEKGKTIRVTSHRHGNNAVVKVIDQGEGIPANHVPLIFDRFHRVDSSRFRDSGGSGLGLAIAKAIVELHNGKIELESEVQKGTTVTITLPIH